MNRAERRALEKQKPRHLHAVKSGEEKRRILWMSNAPWATTGYGQQSAQAIPRFKKAGYDIAIAANYGLEAAASTWSTEYGDVPVYPRGHDQWSNDVIPAHMYDWYRHDPSAEHAMITLFDQWVFKGPRYSDWRIGAWTPIDHMPAPPDVAAWVRQDFVTPIAMSMYGKSMLENVGIASEYVPHAIERVYEPTDFITRDNQQVTAREMMRVPEDAFVVGMNAANKGVYPCRKAFGENILAFSMFAQKHPDAVLYLHTDALGSLGGIKMLELIKSVGLKKDQYRFVDPYMLRTGIPANEMAAIYTGMDVLLATSYGEGFGIPTIEAQACGTRVIVSDFAASTELCGDGWLVGGQPLWDAPQKSFFHVPSIPEIVSALDEAYIKADDRSVKAIDFAAQYQSDVVFDKYWTKALDELFAKPAPVIGDSTRGVPVDMPENPAEASEAKI